MVHHLPRVHAEQLLKATVYGEPLRQNVAREAGILLGQPRIGGPQFAALVALGGGNMDGILHAHTRIDSQLGGAHKDVFGER
jgi:hypothetical protein